MKLVDIEELIYDNWINLYNQDFDKLNWQGTEYDNCTVLRIHSIDRCELNVVINDENKEVKLNDKY